MEHSKKTNRLDSLLDEYREEGTFEGGGTFSINFSVALSKLGQYQLRDLTEYWVRFAQAANLAADSIKLRISGIYDAKMVFLGWDPELTLDKIIESLVGSELGQCREPLDYLRVALVALFQQVDDGVKLTQYIAGQKEVRTVRLDLKNTKTSIKVGPEQSVSKLELEWVESRATEGVRQRKIHPSTVLLQKMFMTRIPIEDENEDYLTYLLTLPSWSDQENKNKSTHQKTIYYHYFGAEGKKAVMDRTI